MGLAWCVIWTTENDLQRFLKEFNKETKNHSKGSLLHRQGHQLEKCIPEILRPFLVNREIPFSESQKGLCLKI